jgi:hypothetical protein
MSAAIVFTYKGRGLSAASTSLRALASTLKAAGVTLTKSSDFLVQLIAAESGGHTPSSYNEISSAPLHTYVNLDTNGINETRYTSVAPLYQPELDYDEQLRIAAKEIAENAELAAKVSGSHIAHLTAGADSRLVGAALKAAGVDSEFVFYCAESSVTREQDIARQVATRMNWTMTRFSGTSTVLGVSGTLRTRQAILESTEGLKTVGPTEGELRAPGITLTGYNGEALKSFYSARLETADGGPFDAAKFTDSIWASNLTDPEHGLLNPEAVGRIRRAIQADIDCALQSGIPVGALGDYIYFKARNRYFAWHSAMERSRYRAQFTPLYSPAMVRLGLSVPLKLRKEGRLHFDLFRMLAPEALEVPFDSPKFTGDTEKLYNSLFKVRSSKNAEPRYDEQRNIPPQIMQRDVSSVKPTSEHVARARRISGVTATDVANEEHYRRLVRQLVLSEEGIAAAVLRRDEIRKLTNSPANSRFRIRILGRLASYLPWYMDHSQGY